MEVARFSAPARSSTTWPRFIIRIRSPYSTAWRRLWVTIMAVRCFSRMTSVGQLHDDLGGLGVQGRRVLVQNQKFQGRHGGHQQRHRLPLAAGESPHPHIQLILQSQAQGGQLLAIEVDTLFIDAPAQAVGPALVIRQGQIFQHGEVGAGAGGGVLVDPAHGGVPLVVLQLGDAPAAHQHVTALDGDRAADDVQQGGLAAAIAAHDGHELALLHCQGEVLEQPLLRQGAGVVDLRDVPYFKHG